MNHLVSLDKRHTHEATTTIRIMNINITTPQNVLRLF